MNSSPSTFTVVVGVLVALLWGSGSSATTLAGTHGQFVASPHWQAEITPLPRRHIPASLDGEEKLSLFGLEDDDRSLKPTDADIDAGGDPRDRDAPNRLTRAGMGFDASDIVGARGDSPVPLPGGFWLLASGLIAFLIWQLPISFHPWRA